MINQLTATDTAVGANGTRDLRIVDPRVHRARLVRHRFQPRAISSLADLPNERPFRQQRSERWHGVYSSLKQARFTVIVFVAARKAQNKISNSKNRAHHTAVGAQSRAIRGG